MTVIPPAQGEPIRPDGPRDPGDAWVEAPTGERYWGRFGAAGLLAVDAERGILLQHRVGWSHFGDTWGLPGGARHLDESAVDGALRESHEEAGVPPEAVRPRFLSVLDREVWTYTTLVAEVTTPFEPVIGDRESVALEWVPLDEVDRHDLHPGFARSWPQLRAGLAHLPAVVVDAANVVGSVPDGWWRDRAGAAERLLARLDRLARGGLAAADLALPEATWFPEIVAVLEGDARTAGSVDHVEIVRAAASGDDALVERARTLLADGRTVTAVTADRELIERLTALDVGVRSPRWLLDRLS